MDYEKKDIIMESKQLYGEINSCITDLVNARIAKNLYNEGRAIFKMEGLMVATMQHLGCVIDFLEEQKEPKNDTTDAKLERVIKAARIVLNNWLDGTDCPDVSGAFVELEYAIRKYDGEENQKEQKPADDKALKKWLVEHGYYVGDSAVAESLRKLADTWDD